MYRGINTALPCKRFQKISEIVIPFHGNALSRSASVDPSNATPKRGQNPLRCPPYSKHEHALIPAVVRIILQRSSMKPQPIIQSETLSTADLAKVLNVSERHVYTLDERGEVPAPIRLGGLKRWTRLSIDQWFAAGCPKRDAAKTQSA